MQQALVSSQQILNLTHEMDLGSCPTSCSSALLKQEPSEPPLLTSLSLSVGLPLVLPPSSPQLQQGQLKIALERVAIILLKEIHGSCLPAQIIISLVSCSEASDQPFIATPYTSARLAASSLSDCLHWWGPDCIGWQSEAHWWAEKHKIMSVLLREALLREKIFWYLCHYPRNLHSISVLASPSFSPSDDPWTPHANERHCCGFNANQYCANIHLRRWLHGERGTSPTWNARVIYFVPAIVMEMHQNACNIDNTDLWK